MLCSRLIKPHVHGRRQQRLLPRERTAFDANAEVLRRTSNEPSPPQLILLLFAGSLVATVVLFRAMPEDFIPADDTGRLNAYTEGANGISFEADERPSGRSRANRLERSQCRGRNSRPVGSGGARGGSNRGSFVIVLKPRSERLPINQVMAELRRKIRGASRFECLLCRTVRPSPSAGS